MRKIFKSVLSISLCALLMFGLIGVGSEGLAEVIELFSVKASAANIESGSCGDNVTYILDTDTGLLTISGTGEMENYDWGDSPFYFSTAIKSVVIETGVTSIGDYAFINCEGFESITIPNSVTSIGERAFRGCMGLESITIPNSVTSIGVCAFYDCEGLKNITIPNSVTSIGDDAYYCCPSLESI